MEVIRSSARSWRVEGHPTIRSAEISAALEQSLAHYASMNDSGWIMKYNGRPIERIIELILADKKNPERDISFGELDLSLFKAASTQ